MGAIIIAVDVAHHELEVATVERAFEEVDEAMAEALAGTVPARIVLRLS